MGVTIKDVAKATGVSTATVSRVINNSPLISPKTAEKVKLAMKKMNYYPSSMARGFSNQNTYNIALVVDINNFDAFDNPFFYKIQYGIEKVICNKGYNLIIANEKTTINKGNTLNRIICEKRADGIIFPALLLKKNIIKNMEDLNIPYVVIGEPPKNYDVNWVDINNKMAGYIATEHLIDNEYRNIAFVSSNQNDTFNMKRYRGYKEALKDNGIAFDDRLFTKNITGNIDGYNLIKNYMDRNYIPDSFVFSSNLAAFGAITALKEEGYNIPDDIGVVSFDNFLVAELTKPEMTTVDIDVLELGIQAGSMLIGEINLPSSSKHNTLLSVKLITRGSAERS
ncbi:LacI family transcriptional regulator [Vallitalea longa]|uniref:LacI family transcriptional regulator n=1 Tax=Vallitalea longa TaxID=2936439 RepID=A0A9W5Y8I3_9FIRM|nr:LacI family DNA-binding transcriptional regulator [Vallitalea longa]GKX27981.1 LacI family transcriptional regulator [Vallitalea longa]